MLSTVLNFILISSSIAMVASGNVVLASDGLPGLSCDRQVAEQTFLKQAPGGARRSQLHVLEVRSKKGIKRYIDQAPFEALGGVHWQYCGYDAAAKAHLIAKSDGGLFSGYLLFEDTGIERRAGHTILFSPDHLQYLAIEQEDGVDGETWAVYDGQGKKKWKGYAGTTDKSDGVEIVVSTFDRPQWIRGGKLAAHYQCSASKVEGTVLLESTTSGQRQWQGHAKC